MNEKDFNFIKYDEDYKDYWFKVGGDTKNFITEKYMEQSLIEVAEIVYSKLEDVLGIKLLFPFNFRVDIINDEELKKIVVNKIREINNNEN